jgi:hypothetical protein
MAVAQLDHACISAVTARDSEFLTNTQIQCWRVANLDFLHPHPPNDWHSVFIKNQSRLQDDS